MRKRIYALWLMAVALCGATAMVSCESDDPQPSGGNEAEEVMGEYSLYFPSITISYWPDTEAGIKEQYEAYQKSFTEALTIEPKKKYKWSDIEAGKTKVQDAFDAQGDYEYSVKSVKNYFSGGFNITLKAYQDGEKSTIDFGKKNFKCKLDVPDDATCQLNIIMSAYEGEMPAVKEYGTSLRKRFTDALKEVFDGEYGTKKDSKDMVYTSIANFSCDTTELIARVREVCNAVEVPALPESVKEEAQTPEGGISKAFDIDIVAYNPKAYAPMKSEIYVFSLKVKTK